VSTPRELFYQQHLPLPLEQVFAFFSDAGNLQAITPEWVGFEILTPRPIAMQAGALIDYRIRLHGIPLRWRTQITVWDPPYRFVDEQLRGPYTLWRHEHRFEKTIDGTLMTDAISYRMMLDWVPGASLIHRFFVRPDLERIFNYRRSALTRALGLEGDSSRESHS
jgi:ligand-binding SRPBCC domain-containing protein